MKRSNKKRFLPLLSLIIMFALFSLISACGGNLEDETGTGTPTGSGQQIASFTGSPTALASGQSSVLTVKVTDSLGVAVSGATVNFDIPINNSGGKVTAINGGITDAGGQAVAIYQAGPTPSALSREDTISAKCGKAAAALVITITASTSSTLQVNISAGSTSLTAGQSTVISATVTDGTGTPIQGKTVTFTKLLDHSTMVLTPIGTVTTDVTGVTDASGKAQAVYTAGTNNPTMDVQDTVSASIDAGASYAAVIITRTANSSAGANGYTMDLTASVISMSATEHSIITATVKDSAGKPINGMTVTFAFVPSPSSIGSTLSVLSGTTDASGSFSTIYTAGPGLSGSVQDTIQTIVTGAGCTTCCAGCGSSSTRAIIITRTATPTSGLGYKISLVATPTSLATGDQSNITATVTDGLDKAVVGITVNFAFVSSPSTIGSTFSVPSERTDASGRASTIYTAGPGLYGSVQEAITASVDDGTYSSKVAVIITRTASTGVGYKLAIATSANNLTAGQSSIITATLKDGGGNLLINKAVTFGFVNSHTGSLNASSATTDASGNAVLVYTAGPTSSQDTIQASYSFGGYSATANVIITTTDTTGYKLAIAASANNLTAGQSSIITATLKDGGNNLLINKSVTFGFVNSHTGSLNASSATTDANGNAVLVYTAGATSSQDTIQASYSFGGYSATADVIMTITAQTSTDTTGYKLAIAANPSNNLTAGQSSIITATLKDGGNNLLINKSVTFGFVNSHTGSLNASSATTDANGNAVLVYTAGATSSQDTIQASYSFGGYSATANVIMTITAPTSIDTTGYKLAIAANPSNNLTAGQSSIITATLKDGGNNLLINKSVTFGFVNSHTGSLNASSATTDASGNAVLVYTAGATSSQDTIQASYSFGGYSATADVIMTITAPTSTDTTGYKLAIAATGGGNLTAGQSSIITATLTDGGNIPVKNQAVTFGFVNSHTGSLDASSATTDASGNAVITYTAITTTTSVVQDVIQASYSFGGYSATNNIIMTVSPSTSTASSYQLTIAANPPTTLTVGQSSVITVTVKDGTGNAITNRTVYFGIVNSIPNGSLNTSTATTGGTNGQAAVTYTNSSAGQDIIYANVTNGTYTYTTYVIVTATP